MTSSENGPTLLIRENAPRLCKKKGLNRTPIDSAPAFCFSSAMIAGQCSLFWHWASTLIERNINQNRNAVELLKDISLVSSYVGLVTKGELILRVTGFIGSCCSYSTSLLKPWEHINFIQVCLQTGLLMRAALLTWEVIQKTYLGPDLSDREVKLFE